MESPPDVGERRAHIPMILTAPQMKAAEGEAFASRATPEGLMEIAGEGIARCVRQFFPKAGTAVVFFGKGHNGGDALVAARHLLQAGWRIDARLRLPNRRACPADPPPSRLLLGSIPPWALRIALAIR